MSGIEGRGRKQPGAKRAVGAPTVPQGAKAKRPKTGGRRKSSLEVEMVRARIASEIAGWHDDTALNEEQAAISLGVSVSTLEYWRSKPNDPDDPRCNRLDPHAAALPLIGLWQPRGGGDWGRLLSRMDDAARVGVFGLAFSARLDDCAGHAEPVELPSPFDH